MIGTSRSTIKSLVPKVLKTVGLTGKENNYPRELSGGEQQRVTIARAYVNHPQLLLADEPTGNLDPTTSLGIMEVLDAISRTGTTIVMATHNEEIVNSMRKRVVELNKGSIVRDEKNGSYDSAMYFPDEQVAAMSHAAINSDAEAESVTVSETSAVIEPAADLPKSRSGKHERDERATTMVDSVNEILQSEHSNEGIARLAQSVHAGKTGRYGEAFADVEQTLTQVEGSPRGARRTGGHRHQQDARGLDHRKGGRLHGAGFREGMGNRDPRGSAGRSRLHRQCLRGEDDARRTDAGDGPRDEGGRTTHAAYAPESAEGAAFATENPG